MKHILNNLSEQEKNSIREQHTGGMKVMSENFSKLLNSKLGDVRPIMEQEIPKTDSTATDKSRQLGQGTGDLFGKTFNFYLDKENKNFVLTGTIKNIEKTSAGLDIRAEFKIGGETTMGEYIFDCDTKEFRFMRGDAPSGYYSNNLAKELTKRFCDVSSGGTEVPAADYVQP